MDIKTELNQKRVALYNVGCRLNTAETATLAEDFAKRGYKIVSFGEEADWIILNTCTVTSRADSTCRNLIRKAVSSSPNGKVVVVGCYSERSPAEVLAIPGVVFAFGNDDKGNLIDLIEGREKKEGNHFFLAKTTKSFSRTRAFLKVQDGCDYFCAYCIIPHARGLPRGSEIDVAIKNAKELINEGFKEIVLTGINLGEYRSSRGERLVDLIKEILPLDGLSRLRLSSIEPNKLDDELLAVLASSNKSMDHFHIPLQSGDDEMLKAMGRRYTTSEFRETLERVRTYFPNSAIGTDCIVGLPNESEDQFLNSFQLLKNLPITHFHVFPYSPRKGTRAFNIKSSVKDIEKKERVEKLIRLGEDKLAQFASTFINRSMPVLFEQKIKSGLWSGLTSNYLRVLVSSEVALANQIKEVRIKLLEGENLIGEIP